MVTLGDVVSGVLQNLNRPQKDLISQVWTRLAGEKAARHTWPHSLTRKRLLVEVENSGWMYTLGMRKRELLQGLIELMGASRVNQLSFRIGERKDA